ncbi:MAG: hypothetical protein HOQ17_16620 [Gemmatimonadaceae bacterium]|nr:hypothetical protein [Gemmatimonadaceae bacterium]NUO95611.1 hypothetical protein [Gemmatimonadaceae bacterium]NUP55238.1 hypothetical protein [Gemmatimonadaceae bacterium]NUP72559.1 hypothetical protein [Gemmatimonadaceae bacterium]NUR35112.1 hypothetical protein [Gemmatimonadaceae bacterium]
MTHDRWTSGDAELTGALRALYAAPAEDSYWEALEARILAHVAHGDEGRAWWGELVDMVRPGLVAAAALILAATLAMAHSQRLEASNAYGSVIASPSSLEASSRNGSLGDGDAAIHYLLSR